MCLIPFTLHNRDISKKKKLAGQQAVSSECLSSRALGEGQLWSVLVSSGQPGAALPAMPEWTATDCSYCMGDGYLGDSRRKPRSPYMLICYHDLKGPAIQEVHCRNAMEISGVLGKDEGLPREPSGLRHFR